MKPARLYADFNNADDLGRLRLNCAGTLADLQRLECELHEGQQLLLHDEELESLATVRFSPRESIWVAELQPQAQRVAG